MKAETKAEPITKKCKGHNTNVKNLQMSKIRMFTDPEVEKSDKF